MDINDVFDKYGKYYKTNDVSLAILHQKSNMMGVNNMLFIEATLDILFKTNGLTIAILSETCEVLREYYEFTLAELTITPIVVNDTLTHVMDQVTLLTIMMIMNDEFEVLSEKLTKEYEAMNSSVFDNMSTGTIH
jgi:hypothetical protein